MSDTPQVNTPPMYGDSNVFNEGAAPPANTFGGEGEPAQAPAQPAANIDRNQMVTVKIDGVETQVPLGEALDGYIQNATYTQKMQEFRAQEAQYKASADFVARLEADPAGTMKLIQEHYQLGSQEPSGYDGGYDQPDPEVTALKQQITQMQQQMERSEAQRQLDTTLTSMYAEIGDGFDRDKVVQYAVDNNISDVRQAWKAMEYDRLKTLEQGQQVQSANQTAAQQALLDQASGVLPGIAPGATRGGPTTGQPVTGSVNSVTDAFLAAKQELNLS